MSVSIRTLDLCKYVTYNGVVPSDQNHRIGQQVPCGEKYYAPSTKASSYVDFKKEYAHCSGYKT